MISPLACWLGIIAPSQIRRHDLFLPQLTPKPLMEWEKQLWVTLPTVRVATMLFHVFLPMCTDAQYQPLPHTLQSCVCSASCISPGLLIDKASKCMPKEIFQRKVSWHKLGLWHISVWRADWPSEPAADYYPPTAASGLDFVLLPPHTLMPGSAPTSNLQLYF